MLRSVLTAAIFLVSVIAGSASAEPAALNSHEVNADHSVTFRYYGPAAKQVTLLLDYSQTSQPLQKGGDGVWSLTTPALAPELHFYTFVVDGVPNYDPLNLATERSLVFTTNEVRVLGATPQPWDVRSVPHGVVHRHSYASAIIQGLTDGQEEFYVYTPPGYNLAGSARYPVLYLLHGWSALAEDWVEAGQANLILDNLIAQGRAEPMIVVMPQSYGDMSFVRNGFKVWDDPAQIARNSRLLGDALLQEIAPQVDAQYRVSGDHAIAGLSMGGGQSLLIGLNHLEYFGWVGGMSSALPAASFEGLFPKMSVTGPSHLLWIACATEEEDIGPTRQLVTWLKGRGLSPTAVEIPGIHNWHTWRDNFIHLAPLLFRKE